MPTWEHWAGMPYEEMIRCCRAKLKLDGQLHIIEATSRFASREQFVQSLEVLGFAVVTVEDKWKFTHIRALKTERRPRQCVELRF